MGKRTKKSIIPQKNEEKCFICGAWRATDRHHCLHGSMRKKADEDGLTVMLCHECHMELHDHGTGDRLLQQIAQYHWEQTYGTRDEFRARYGKSYL